MTSLATTTPLGASADVERPDPTAAVELFDAAATMGGRRVWSGVDLQIVEGEFVAVLGPNGAGKSTLLRLLLGAIAPSAGSVRVLGGAPGSQNRVIGYLPQRHAFDAQTRIRGIDLVRLGLDGARWGLPLPRRSHERARVAEAIELVGAAGYARRAIGECSGGEQQRLLIAQAVVSRPRMLLLDEPLDSLDLPNQSAVTSLLDRIRRALGMTVVLVAHDVNPLLAHLDRVVYVAGGGMLAGTPEAIITSETLSGLYHAPIEVLRTSDGRLVVVGQPETASCTPHQAAHP